MNTSKLPATASRRKRPGNTVQGVAEGIDHGTIRGYRQHKYRGVPVCGPCRDACREDSAALREKAAAKRPPKADAARKRKAWNEGMTGESRPAVTVSATPPACTEPECGTAGPVPDGWVAAEVDGAVRRYCRSWCAVYAQALADVRSIGRAQTATDAGAVTKSSTV